MKSQQLFSAPASRVSAATLGVLIAAVIVTAGMPVYLPLNEANKIVLPIILFPVTWLVLFLWVLFERRIWRAWTALLGLVAIHGAIIASGLGAI